MRGKLANPISKIIFTSIFLKIIWFYNGPFIIRFVYKLTLIVCSFHSNPLLTNLLEMAECPTQACLLSLRKDGGDGGVRDLIQMQQIFLAGQAWGSLWIKIIQRSPRQNENYCLKVLDYMGLDHQFMTGQ